MYFNAMSIVMHVQPNAADVCCTTRSRLSRYSRCASHKVWPTDSSPDSAPCSASTPLPSHFSYTSCSGPLVSSHSVCLMCRVSFENLSCATLVLVSYSTVKSNCFRSGGRDQSGSRRSCHEGFQFTVHIIRVHYNVLQVHMHILYAEFATCHLGQYNSHHSRDHHIVIELDSRLNDRSCGRID